MEKSGSSFLEIYRYTLWYMRFMIGVVCDLIFSLINTSFWYNTISTVHLNSIKNWKIKRLKNLEILNVPQYIQLASCKQQVLGYENDP